MRADEGGRLEKSGAAISGRGSNRGKICYADAGNMLSGGILTIIFKYGSRATYA
jgi:hypothetical protein